jgi:hypothetical protein
VRAREILYEDYNSNLLADLNNILVTAKATGIDSVKTSSVVSQLYQMGYAVDSNSIMTLLTQVPIAVNSTPDQISLAQPEGASSATDDPTQDSAAKVSDMAQAATKIG